MIKTHNTNGYLPIPVSVIKDPALSLEEKALYGIISYYEQLPGFFINRSYICHRHGIGQYALKSCMMKLQERHYASCSRKGGKWLYYSTCKDDAHYTPIFKTILSSDLSLKEIGLYMIIAYTITIPNVQLSLNLYVSYCRDCRRSCMSVSKRLQLAGLYEQHKESTCNYTYKLNILHPDGSFSEYASTLPLRSERDLEILGCEMPPNDEETKSKAADTLISKNERNNTATYINDIKELLFYDHETKNIYDNYRDGCYSESRKIAYDMLVSAIDYAKQIKYVKINGIKLYYEKFYQLYVAKLGDRTIREHVIKRILDTIHGESNIHNLNLYICGLIGKTVPIAMLSEKRNEYHGYITIENMYGKQTANTEYTSHRKNGFHYDYAEGSFIRISGEKYA